MNKSLNFNSTGKHLLATLLLFITSFVGFVSASEEAIPEPFRGDDASSQFYIDYEDLDILLSSMVIDTGLSKREKADKSRANIGTRLKAQKKRLTSLEGNRFWFEAFKQDNTLDMLKNIRDSLADVPTQAPLKYFSRNEQLAYWLNLYNVTILNEIAQVYPEKDLEDLITDDDSILEKKLLTVNNIPLSLNDIQNKILANKFAFDPVIIYGFYQGYIGSPNIRNHAYTGANVYRSLLKNAEQFINSNRGTYSDSEKYFRVSSFYERNEDFFPEFQDDLRKHLLVYLDSDMVADLEGAYRIRPNIDDWSVTDIFGTTRDFGGSNATNPAALLDSAARPEITGQVSHFDGVSLTVRNVTGNRAGGEEGNAGFYAPSLGAVSESYASRAIDYGRFNQEQASKIKALMLQQVQNTGIVTISQDEPQTSTAEESSDQ